MFALWYLSLAVDEMRKHFGWTFFDIFYTKKDSTLSPNKAIDNKPTNVTELPSGPSGSKAAITVPSVTPKPAPVAPKPTEVKPEPKPAPVPKPAPASAPAASPAPTPAPAPTRPAPAVAPPRKSPSVSPPKPVAAPAADSMPVPITTPTRPAPAPEQRNVTNGSMQNAMDKKLQEAARLKENGENIRNNLKNATADFLNSETKSPVKMIKISDGCLTFNHANSNDRNLKARFASQLFIDN